ncbi:MAG: efflux transporter outer membrane subunit [Rudaea sp.]|nr:efflux transporter outer membrane subunit [Rudaea sp.]
MKKDKKPLFPIIVLATSLAGCSLAPELKTPPVPTAAAYKEIPSGSAAPWIAAQPADRLARDAWWTLYGDAQLDGLQKELVANNPDLAAALASYQQARSFSDQVRAGLFPSVTGSADVERDLQSATAPRSGTGKPLFYDSNTVGAGASYELDLWGRIRNQVASGNAQAAAAAADLENARLSLIAQLVDDYIQLRGFDRDSAILDDTVKAYRRALELTKQRHDGGIAPGLDVARAQTQLDVARSQAAQTLAQRALMEHAIAALVGESASQFSLAAQTDAIKLPQVPTGIPSTLLQRRPDVAAAQRRMQSANADIGVARAAFFPSITLNATAGYQSSQFPNWLQAPNSFWAIGPSALLSIFDAGKRKAQVAQARAVLDETSAKYRSVALGAFQQVEDNLALLDHYHDAAEAENSAVAAAQRSLDFSMDRYRQGAVNYLDVVTSQTAALQTQRDALDLDTRQLRASVQLIRALGGGWEEPGTDGVVQANAAAAGK